MIEDHWKLKLWASVLLCMLCVLCCVVTILWRWKRLFLGRARKAYAPCPLGSHSCHTPAHIYIIEPLCSFSNQTTQTRPSLDPCSPSLARARKLICYCPDPKRGFWADAEAQYSEMQQMLDEEQRASTECAHAQGSLLPVAHACWWNRFSRGWRYALSLLNTHAGGLGLNAHDELSTKARGTRAIVMFVCAH